MGFEPSLHPHEYTKVQNGVLCGVSYRIEDTAWPGRTAMGEGSFSMSLGVTYPKLELGFADITEEPEIWGFAVSGLRGALTRTVESGCTGPANVWDLAQLFPDEAIADLIAAFDQQAPEWFDYWSDHQKAWDFLRSGYTLPEEADVPEDAAGAVALAIMFTSDSSMGISTLASLAAKLGYVEKEIEILRFARDESTTGVGGGPLGLSEPQAERLSYLESL